MAKNWEIKISESDNPELRGFYVTVESNGEYVGGIKGIISDFNRAVEEGKNIILSQVKILKEKIKHAKHAQDIIAKQFLMNKMLSGIYGVGIMFDENGEPYLEVSMNTNNEYLMQLVPNSIIVPNTMFEYKIQKVYGEQSVAQQGNGNIKR